MKNKVKIIMLPTEDITNLVLFNNTPYLNNGYIKEDNQYLLGDEFSNSHQEPATAFKFQHAYATISQEIEPVKKGDWCYDIENKVVFQFKHYNMGVLHSDNHSQHEVDCSKVIATTDPMITIKGCETCNDTKLLSLNDNGILDCYDCKPIPQLQQSFLKEYVANPNGKYEVEYEENIIITQNKPILQHQGSKYKIVPHITEYKLKLNQNNEVTITSVDINVCSRCNGEMRIIDYSLQVNGGNDKYENEDGKMPCPTCEGSGYSDEDCEHISVEKKMYSKDEVERKVVEGMRAMNKYIIDTSTMKGQDAKVWSINWIKENL